MSARDDLTPERLAEITDLLRYESSIAFYSSRAKESMLLLLADAKERRAVRAEGLSESERAFLAFALGLAADVMASRGDEFTAEDEAALTPLRHMAAAPAAVPVPDETAGDETESAVEFGVRVPYDVLLPTTVREDADTYLGRLRDMYPDAVLVQRTVRYGAWTGVAS